MARHRVAYDELNGYIVDANIASTTASPNCPAKSLWVRTTVGETSNVIYIVKNEDTRNQHEYDNYGDALQAYNWI